jgi:hypothetical protein
MISTSGKFGARDRRAQPQGLKPSFTADSGGTLRSLRSLRASLGLEVVPFPCLHMASLVARLEVVPFPVLQVPDLAGTAEGGFLAEALKRAQQYGLPP